MCCREAVGSYAENQRITAVRRVYQRGTVTPMHSVEQLWKEYCIYENVSISVVSIHYMLFVGSEEGAEATRTDACEIIKPFLPSLFVLSLYGRFSNCIMFTSLYTLIQILFLFHPAFNSSVRCVMNRA